MIRPSQLKSLAHLLNPAGGLYYHLRGFRHSQTLWSGLREWVMAQAQHWPQKSERLVLVGSSAGYTIPSPLLERYSKVTCIDPDPLAPFLFRRRHPMVRPEWRHESVLGEKGLRLLQEFSDADLLFSNFLGQVIFLLGDSSRAAKYICDLRTSLGDRNFASYHDVFSIVTPKKWNPPLESPRAPGERVEVLESNAFDHGTKDCFLDLSRQYYWWPILPRRWHQIEWVQAADKNQASS